MKRNKSGGFVRTVLVAALVGAITSGCADSPQVVTPPESPIAPTTTQFGSTALQYAVFLEDNLGFRRPFTERERDTADWLVSELIGIGFQPAHVSIQQFGFAAIQPEFAELPISQVESLISIVPWMTDAELIPNSQNVIAHLNGSSPTRVIVGAHYDTTNTPGGGDNGSGVGLLLELATELLASGEELPYTIDFVFFGAEELALTGSRYFVSELSATELEAIKLMANADALFDHEELFFAAGISSADGLQQLTNPLTESIAQLATTAEFNLVPFPGGIFAPTDSQPFALAGIPVVNLFAIDVTPYNFIRSPDTLIDTPEDSISIIGQRWPGRMEDALDRYGRFLYELLHFDW